MQELNQMKNNMKKSYKKILIYTLSVFLLLFIIFAISFQYSRSWENAFILDPIYKLDTEDKLVALSFDDGPSETRTPALLELLEQYNVKAMFFMLGNNIEKYPEIAKDVFEAGHLIGNHSYDHPRLIFKSPSFMKEQILKTETLINETGQEKVKYFRPPYSSKYLILPWQLKKLDKELVTGTYDPPAEYIEPYNAENVANQVIENIQPGSIIYLHDGKDSDVEEFVKSVELIINGLREIDYEFVRLDYEN